ncbi:MAG: hypothetical protein SFV23_15440, partial [Planctomycetaceae bacterium]|nr:hypothetical protein [Planctomycetaceae bacterium]
MSSPRRKNPQVASSSTITLQGKYEYPVDHEHRQVAGARRLPSQRLRLADGGCLTPDVPPTEVGSARAQYTIPERIWRDIAVMAPRRFPEIKASTIATCSCASSASR